MDGKHEGLSDETLAREIEAALGVDPSPEFLPRVRARIANERIPESWFSASWRWAGAVAVVTVAAVIGIWTLRDSPPAPREARVEQPPIETTTPSIEPEPPATATSPAVRAVRTARRPEVVTRFEVVTSPDEAAALRQLVAAITARQVEATDIPTLGAESAPLPLIEEIVLEPIKLSPMAGTEAE